MRCTAVAAVLTVMLAMAAPAGAASRAPAGIPAVDAVQTVLQWFTRFWPAPVTVSQPAAQSPTRWQKQSGMIDPDGKPSPTAGSSTSGDRSTGVDPDG